MTTKHPESFKKFMGIYYEAHEEEKSYVKYLLFMMFIESLVVDDEQTGVTYKLARMCAVLVGDNAESSLDIFKKMKKSYTVRSQLVHSAKNQIDTGNYLMFIHSIVCELIITIILNRLETKDLFSQATVMGFGERSAIWKDRNYKNMYNFWMNEINFILDLKETSK